MDGDIPSRCPEVARWLSTAPFGSLSIKIGAGANDYPSSIICLLIWLYAMLMLLTLLAWLGARLKLALLALLVLLAGLGARLMLALLAWLMLLVMRLTLGLLTKCFG